MVVQLRGRVMSITETVPEQPNGHVSAEKKGLVNGTLESAEQGQEEQVQQPGDVVAGLENAVKDMHVEQPASGQAQGGVESDLHRFCAEGRLDDVRAVLSRKLEGIETLGRSSGHHDQTRRM